MNLTVAYPANIGENIDDAVIFFKNYFLNVQKIDINILKTETEEEICDKFKNNEADFGIFKLFYKNGNKFFETIYLLQSLNLTMFDVANVNGVIYGLFNMAPINNR